MPEYPRDSLREWAGYYLEMAVTGIRSEAVTHKIRFHLARFQAFFEERYGQENMSLMPPSDQPEYRNQSGPVIVSADQPDNRKKRKYLSHTIIRSAGLP